MLLGVLLGLVCALCWGTADIFATIVSRRLGIYTALYLSQSWGVLLAFALLLFTWQPLAITPHALLISLPAGLVLGILLAVGYLAFYRGLELGPLAIVSPLTAVDGAVAVVLAMLFLHEKIGTWQGFALITLFIGVLLAALEGTSPLAFLKELRTATFAKGGAKWGFVAMIVFGFALFGIGLATQTFGWFLPVFWMRVFSLIIVVGVSFFQQKQFSSHTLLLNAKKWERRGSWWLAIGLMTLFAGMLDTGGNFLYGFDTGIAATGIAAAVGSCFVLLPLLYGAFVLRERLAIHQVIGVLLVLVGLIVLGYSSV
jgi:drug/metabolite transporter (DMT)-like permease